MRMFSRDHKACECLATTCVGGREGLAERFRTAPGRLTSERKLHRTQSLGLAQPLRLPGLLGSTLGMAANSCALPPTALRTLRPRKRRGIVRVRRARRHPDGFVEIQHLVSSEGGDISLQNGPQVRVATL